MLFAMLRRSVEAPLNRMGFERNRSLKNAYQPAVSPPDHLYDLAVRICTRGPNPDGLAPSDLLIERYPGLVVSR